MKKTILILSLILILALLVWFYLPKRVLQPIKIAKSTNAVNQSLSPEIISNEPVTQSMSQATNTAPTNEVFNAFALTNLEQWTNAVKDLKKMGGFQFSQSWVFEQQQPNRKGPDRNTGKLFILNYNGKTVPYTASFISLDTKNGSDDLLEVALQSSNMNIDETRQLGLQLLDMLQMDSQGFTDWCNQVGNHWVDAPLWGTSGNRHMGFHILRGYNDEKPWLIEFVIQNP
mgnify:FL=1